MANTGTIKLTQEQKDKILMLSRQAQAFKQSELFLELKRWVEVEREVTMQEIVTNKRGENEKDLTRTEFVERKSSYYLSILTLLTIFNQYADQEKELQKLEEYESKRSTDQSIS